MKAKKTVNNAPYSLELIPITSIEYFAVIQSRAILKNKVWNSQIEIVPGTLVTDVQDEVIGNNTTYKINHTFTCANACIENEQQMYLLSRQLFIAIYINECGQKVVSGSQQYPLTFSYSSKNGHYECKLTGVSDNACSYI